MRLPVHRWFRYTAGYSAQWVESLLAADHSGRTIRVLDPFAGSGTTLLAAQSAGVESFGIDSQPFVARIAKAKLLWTSSPIEVEARSRLILQSYKKASDFGEPPTLLAKCYTPSALADLYGLREAIAQHGGDDDISRLLWLAFVSIIRSTSFVGTAQWQYVLPNKRKQAIDPLTAFRSQVQMMVTDIIERQAELPKPPAATFVEADCRETGIVPSGWSTHVICSPPYANNYDYADATRLEQTMLGEVDSWSDLKALRTGLIRSCSQHMVQYDTNEAFQDPILKPIIDELKVVYDELDQARLQHGGKKAYHSMIVAYFHDMAKVWIALRDACSEGASVCFVIGDSAPYGVYVPVERWLAELALAAGFKSWSFEKVRDRNIKWKNRKHTVPLHEGRLLVEG